MNQQEKQWVHRTGDEHSASISIDSLENSREAGGKLVENEITTDSLNQTDESNKCPSFQDVLSSSFVHSDENPGLKLKPPVCDVVRNLNKLTAARTFIIHEHVNQASPGPNAVDTNSKESCLKQPHVCEKSEFSFRDEEVVHTHPEECSVVEPSAATSASESKEAKCAAKREFSSHIPVSIRSKLSLRKINQYSHDPATFKDDSEPESKTTSLPHPAISTKRAARCHSQLAMERPRRDFIQLNKRGDFRRSRTYHALHLERRGQRPMVAAGGHTADESDGSPPPAAEDTASPAPASQGDPALSAGSHQPESSVTPGAGAAGGARRRSRSRIPVRVGARAAPDRREEFHESQLSYDSSEWELAVPGLRLPPSQLSLIDVNDNRPLILDTSAPCLLQHSCRHKDPLENLIVLEENVSTISLQIPSTRTAKMPPERVPLKPRVVDYKPNLKPYPRQYVNLGKLGPDPDIVRSRQDKARRQQQYAEQVARKNRAAVRTKGQLYSQPPSANAQSSHQKMVSYAKTVPKPKPKPRATSSGRESPEISPLSKIRRLLAESGFNTSDPPSKSPSAVAAGGGCVPACKPPPSGGPGASRQPAAAVLQPRPPARPAAPAAAPTPTSVCGRRPPRRPAGRSQSVGQARVTSSLSRLRSLTERLAGGGPARACASAAAPPRRDDSRSTLDADSDAGSDYSLDSLAEAGRPPVVTLGRRRGSTSPRGRGLFPPERADAACRRPAARCSRGVGPGAAAAADDVFFDSLPRGDERGGCPCGDEECAPPAPAQRRPAVTRGTQSASLDAPPPRKDPLVVDIGLPQGGGRAPRLGARQRLRSQSPDSPAGSPRPAAGPSRAEELARQAEAIQRLRERHLRDKRRVDQFICGSLTRM